jgi:hypothetical protein
MAGNASAAVAEVPLAEDAGRSSRERKYWRPSLICTTDRSTGNTQKFMPALLAV